MNGSIKFCDIYGNICFENVMQNITLEEDCVCPRECNYRSYSFSFVSTPFDPKKMRPRGVSSIDFMMEQFYLNKSPPQFIRRLKEIKDNVTADVDTYCKRNIQYRAEVIFRLATDSVSLTVITKRLSFFDKLSAFGKNETYI